MRRNIALSAPRLGQSAQTALEIQEWSPTVWSEPLLPKDRIEAEELGLIRLNASKEDVERFVEELNRLRSPSGEDRG